MNNLPNLAAIRAWLKEPTDDIDICYDQALMYIKQLMSLVDKQSIQIDTLVSKHAPLIAEHERRLKAIEKTYPPAPEPTRLRTWLVKANIVSGDWKGTITAPADLDRVALENHFIAALGEALGENFLCIRTYYDANDGSYEPPMPKGGNSK